MDPPTTSSLLSKGHQVTLEINTKCCQILPEVTFIRQQVEAHKILLAVSFISGRTIKTATFKKKNSFLINFCYCCCCLVTQLCLTHLLPHGPQPARLLCPLDFSGKNAGSGLPFPSSRDLSNAVHPALQVDSFFFFKYFIYLFHSTSSLLQHTRFLVVACAIQFPDQDPTPGPCTRSRESQPLGHQASPAGGFFTAEPPGKPPINFKTKLTKANHRIFLNKNSVISSCYDIRFCYDKDIINLIVLFVYLYHL